MATYIDEKVCPSCTDKPCRLAIRWGRTMPWLVKNHSIPLFCPIRVDKNDWNLSLSRIGNSDADKQAAFALHMSPVWSQIRGYNFNTQQRVHYFLHNWHLALLDLNKSAAAMRQVKEYDRRLTESLHRAAEKEATLGKPETEAIAEIRRSLSSPTWEYRDEESENAVEEAKEALEKEALYLKITQTGLMPGDSVNFSIYQKGKQERLTTVVGRVGENSSDNTAVAKWIVPETIKEQSLGEDDGFYFIAKSAPYNLKIQSHVIPFKPRKCVDCLEVPSNLFHRNSTVPLWEENGLLAGILMGTLEYAAKHPGKLMIAFGHSDPSGEHALNTEISEWRAKAIKALLEGEPDDWVNGALKFGRVEDYQLMIGSLAGDLGIDASPGKVDGNHGPKTDSALKSFVRAYNQKFKSTVAENGKMGSAIWKAIFRVQSDTLNKLWKQDHGKKPMPTLQYGNGGKGWYGCGESFPLSQEDKKLFTSRNMRRVEIHFYDKGQEPALPGSSAKTGPQNKKDVEAYDSRKVKKNILSLNKVTPNSFDIHKAVAHLDSHAKEKSQGRCARYVREALQAGGGVISPPYPLSAKDYGPRLIHMGFAMVSSQDYTPRKGDVVVFQAPSTSPHGHIQMYNGRIWVSDFFQSTQQDIYPGHQYRKDRVNYEIFRYE